MINVDQLRYYLLRDIANKDGRIRGFLTKQVRVGTSYNDGFNEILHFFAGGKNSQVLDLINEHRGSNESKRFSIYNYFDIDTLIAYNQYLQTIISEVDVATYESGRKTASLADYRKGLAEAQKTFVNLAGSRESGFYNPKKPIGLMYRYKEGKRELFPMKAPAKNILEEKGKYYAYQALLKVYLDGRRLRNPNAQKNPGQISYKHNGRKFDLNVDKIAYYCDVEGAGLKYIEASAREGRLFGTYRTDGSVYHGDLYDREGMLVEIDGGGEYFYETTPGSQFKFDEKDEDQMTFF